MRQLPYKINNKLLCEGDSLFLDISTISDKDSIWYSNFGKMIKPLYESFKLKKVNLTILESDSLVVKFKLDLEPKINKELNEKLFDELNKDRSYILEDSECELLDTMFFEYLITMPFEFKFKNDNFKVIDWERPLSVGLSINKEEIVTGSKITFDINQEYLNKHLKEEVHSLLLKKAKKVEYKVSNTPNRCVVLLQTRFLDKDGEYLSWKDCNNQMNYEYSKLTKKEKEEFGDEYLSEYWSVVPPHMNYCYKELESIVDNIKKNKLNYKISSI